MIPALKSLRQEDHKFKPVWVTWQGPEDRRKKEGREKTKEKEDGEEAEKNEEEGKNYKPINFKSQALPSMDSDENIYNMNIYIV